jgi:hypothetical protein
VRDRVQEQVNNALGDYHHLNPLEKTVRNSSSPSTPGTAPSRATASTWRSTAPARRGGGEVGELGTQTTEQKLGGDIPDFMKGSSCSPVTARTAARTCCRRRA